MAQGNSKLIYEHKKSRDTLLYKGLIGLVFFLCFMAISLVVKFGSLSDAIPIITGCFIIFSLIVLFCWEYLNNASDIKFFEDHIELDGEELSWSAVKSIEQTMLFHFIRVCIQKHQGEPALKIVITNRFTNKELFILSHHTKLADFLIKTWRGKGTS